MVTARSLSCQLKKYGSLKLLLSTGKKSDDIWRLSHGCFDFSRRIVRQEFESISTLKAIWRDIKYSSKWYRLTISTCSITKAYDISLDETMPFRVLITHDGYVLWVPFLNLVTSCDMDMIYFPFDYQICSIQISYWTYPVDNGPSIRFHIASEVDVNYFTPNGIWTLQNTSARFNFNLSQPSAEILVRIQREPR